MHESTVSRVTSNKYLACDRGLFELKYFFTSGIQSSDGGDAVSAEAVKSQIKALIAAEDPRRDPLRRPARRDAAAPRASTSPAAPSPNIARRSGSAPRCSGAGRRRSGHGRPEEPAPGSAGAAIQPVFDKAEGEIGQRLGRHADGDAGADIGRIMGAARYLAKRDRGRAGISGRGLVRIIPREGAGDGGGAGADGRRGSSSPPWPRCGRGAACDPCRAAVAERGRVRSTHA